MNDKAKDLILFAKTGKIDELVEVIEGGADVNCQDPAGDTALMHAAGRGRVDVVNRLLCKGADPNRKNLCGQSALTIARLNGHEEISRLLEMRTVVASASKEVYDIANTGAPASQAYFELLPILASDRPTEIDDISDIIVALYYFITFALPNGFIDQLRQAGLDSIKDSAELMKRIDERELGCVCEQAVALIFRQIERDAIDGPVEEMRFDEDIVDKINALDKQLFQMDARTYMGLFEKTLCFVKHAIESARRDSDVNNQKDACGGVF